MTLIEMAILAVFGIVYCLALVLHKPTGYTIATLGLIWGFAALMGQAWAVWILV